MKKVSKVIMFFSLILIVSGCASSHLEENECEFSCSVNAMKLKKINKTNCSCERTLAEKQSQDIKMNTVNVAE